MFIRTTPTRNSATGETYITQRLLESRRVGGRGRQVTLLNLGRHFPLVKERWPDLCARLEQILSGQQALMPMTLIESVERYAQHCFFRLVAQGGVATSASTATAASPAAFVEVDPDSMEFTPKTAFADEQNGQESGRLGFW